MRHFVFVFFVPFLLQSQSIKRTLQKSSSVYFRNTLFVFGFEQNKMEAGFKVYRIANNLSRIDSLAISLGKDKAENYLEINADTLHGFLNFYLQKANNKNKASLIRLSDSLRIISRADNFDVTKVNSLTSFEDEKFVCGNSIYLVRTSEDSLGKQFYLDRFDVTDLKKPFEYIRKWQFPFEKKHIKTAHVFYSDSTITLIYVHVLTSEKTGEWVLRLNSKSGELIKGSKLNPKGDKRHFLFSNFYYDKKSRQVLVCGNIYTPAQINFETPSFNFTGLNKQNTFFFTVIDSLGEVTQREEKTFPLNIPANPKLKQVFYYHIKVREIRKKSDSEYRFYCDVYKNSGQELIFLYETGLWFDLTLSEMQVDITTEKMFMNLSGMPSFVTADPKDINGKFELKSISEFDKFLYSAPLSDIEKYYGKDDLSNPKWILSKTDLKTANTSFYLIRVGAKGVEQKLMLEDSKYDHPNIYKINNEKVILVSTDISGTVVEVSLVNW